MFLPHFDVFCDLLLNQTHGNMESSLFYIITKSLFYFKIFQHNAKAGLLPRLWPAFARKKPVDVIYDRFKMKQFHWLYSKESSLVEKNRTTVKPDSSVAPRWMKTYNERRIELRNLQILQKLMEKSSPFLSSKQPCKPKIKAWMLPWKIAGVEKYPRKTCDCGQPRGHLIRVLNERSVNDGGDYFLSSVVGDSQISLI